MKILGIETSCDETAAAVVENGTRILSNVVVSQIDLHQAYGGVVPEIAARSHIEVILPVIEQALLGASLSDASNGACGRGACHAPTFSPTAATAPCEDRRARERTPLEASDKPSLLADIDTIAVTHTPGLLGSLLIGTLTARTLAILHDKPLHPTHHLKSHIYANWLTSGDEGKDRRARERTPSETPILPSFPLIALVVSGGHTQLIHMAAHNHFEIIGTTKDDAIGEVFDKIAKILGLPYPGGPAISKTATKGNPKKYPLPHPKMPNFDFSFSGLKTAVLRAIQKELNLPISTPSTELANKLSPQQIADFSASFQDTAIDTLIEKLSAATEKYQPKSILLAGGVAADSLLRTKVTQKFSAHTPVFFPEPKLSTDNAAMVASAAYFAIQSGEQPTDPYDLDISPRSQIS